jgi:hypothetical protein
MQRWGQIAGEDRGLFQMSAGNKASHVVDPHANLTGAAKADIEIRKREVNGVGN